jgi:hypothetical protein
VQHVLDGPFGTEAFAMELVAGGVDRGEFAVATLTPRSRGALVELGVVSGDRRCSLASGYRVWASLPPITRLMTVGEQREDELLGTRSVAGPGARGQKDVERQRASRRRPTAAARARVRRLLVAPGRADDDVAASTASYVAASTASSTARVNGRPAINESTTRHGGPLQRSRLRSR